jgi:Tol biopolymer transport system component
VCGPYSEGEGEWPWSPAWSPDGRYLAFGCQGTVNIADPARGIVASFPGLTIGWSPDSTRVATLVDGRPRKIGIYGLDGVRQTLLTKPPHAGDYYPVWSPDGRSLVVPFGVELPIDGGAPRKLSGFDPRKQRIVTYSPDGARVAYISAPDALTVAAVDGSNAHVLVSDAVNDPVWSPTEDLIAFDVQAMGSTYLFPATEIRIVDVASGAVTPIAGMGGAGILSVIGFSPDGERILFSRRDAAGVSSLWSVRTDGSDLQLLVKGADWGEWQPVGTTR